MLINPFKTDYDQKTVFDGSSKKLAREVDEGFKIAAKKYGWPDMSFRSQINAECRQNESRRIRSKEAKTLDFNMKVDNDFPVEFN